MWKWNKALVLWRRRAAMKMHKYSQEITRSLHDEKQKHPIYALDGIRGLACLGVVMFHINLWTLYTHAWYPYLDNLGALFSSLALFGESAVLLFFLLSGFLLFMPFAKAMLFDTPWPSLKRFYLRRIFRIVPGYYVALFLMLLFVNPTYLQAVNWDKLWLFITFRMDFPLTYQQFNTPFWTLAIEFQFYMLLPWLAVLMRQIVSWGSLKFRLIKLSACLLVMFAWGMLTRYWGFKVADTTAWDALVPRTIADVVRPYIFGTVGKFFESFALGMLLCMLYLYAQHTPSNQNHLQLMRRLSPICGVVGASILFVINIWHYYVIYMIHQSLHFLDPYQMFLTGYRDVFMQVGYSLGYAFCLFGVLQGSVNVRRFFSWAPFRWLGFISFSLYMWHYPFILYYITVLLPRFQSLQWSLPAQYSTAVLWMALTTIPLSVILYQCIERPGIRMGEYLCRRLVRNEPLRELDGMLATPVAQEVPVSVAASTGKSSRLRRQG